MGSSRTHAGLRFGVKSWKSVNRELHVALGVTTFGKRRSGSGLCADGSCVKTPNRCKSGRTTIWASAA
jgi:hypothetical protein